MWVRIMRVRTMLASWWPALRSGRLSGWSLDLRHHVLRQREGTNSTITLAGDEFKQPLAMDLILAGLRGDATAGSRQAPGLQPVVMASSWL